MLCRQYYQQWTFRCIVYSVIAALRSCLSITSTAFVRWRYYFCLVSLLLFSWSEFFRAYCSSVCDDFISLDRGDPLTLFTLTATPFPSLFTFAMIPLLLLKADTNIFVPFQKTPSVSLLTMPIWLAVWFRPLTFFPFSGDGATGLSSYANVQPCGEVPRQAYHQWRCSQGKSLR